MPEGVGMVIILLCIGYFLFLAEAVVPGGVLGVLGASSIVWGCWMAFGLSMGWGLSSVAISLVVFVGLTWFLVKNRSEKGLILGGDEAKTWKSAKEGLAELMGVEGVTLTPLRPSGTMMVGEERIDVVADGEFIDGGVRVQVIEVEGSRVVVDDIEVLADEPAPAEVPADLPAGESAGIAQPS